jgi:hypothetical protein
VTRFAAVRSAKLCESEALITQKARQQWQQTELQLRGQQAAGL